MGGKRQPGKGEMGIRRVEEKHRKKGEKRQRAKKGNLREKRRGSRRKKSGRKVGEFASNFTPICATYALRSCEQ